MAYRPPSQVAGLEQVWHFPAEEILDIDQVQTAWRVVPPTTRHSRRIARFLHRDDNNAVQSQR